MLIEKYTSPHSGLVVAQAQRFPALLHGHMDMEPAKKGQNCAGLIHSVLSDPSMSHPLSSWLFSPQAILLYSSLQRCRAFFYYSSASSLAQLHKPPSLHKAALKRKEQRKNKDQKCISLKGDTHGILQGFVWSLIQFKLFLLMC